MADNIPPLFLLHESSDEDDVTSDDETPCCVETNTLTDGLRSHSPVHCCVGENAISYNDDARNHYVFTTMSQLIDLSDSDDGSDNNELEKEIAQDTGDLLKTGDDGGSYCELSAKVNSFGEDGSENDSDDSSSDAGSDDGDETDAACDSKYSENEQSTPANSCGTASGGQFVPQENFTRSCPTCKMNKAAATTDDSMTHRAFNINLKTFHKINSCQHGCDKGCSSLMTLAILYKYRDAFWGSGPAISATTRRQKIKTELTKARQQYLDKSKRLGVVRDVQFVFVIEGREVCEKAFVNILGIADSNGHKSKMWNSQIASFDDPRDDLGHKTKKEKSLAYRSKRDHAYAYIRRVIESAVTDRSAFKNQENTVYLPYRRLRFFYGEYDWYCQSLENARRARESTFRRAFKDLKERYEKELNKKIKFTGANGSFDKCDICHNADQLLRRTAGWSEEERDIIKEYRRRHINQQFDERIKLQDNIDSTYLLDAVGRPKAALLLPDGMTVVTGNTPRIGFTRAKGDVKTITTRIIGVECHCGPIHGTILYYTDNLASGGANTMIEVVRQAILDLKVLLEESKVKDKLGNSLDVPDHLILQFDNCGENKNKYVFSYLSLLVQAGHFRVIDVFFLVVGHTHTSIDQFFSVISRIIHGTYFISSPISLQSLLSNADIANCISAWAYSDDKSKKLKSKPLLVRKIAVIFDMKASLQPWINPKIKYYGIPHQFRLEMFQGICAMQYKLFSTHKEFLPRRPQVCADFKMEDSLDIAIDLFALVGGKSNFMEACGASAGVSDAIISNKGKKALEAHNTLQRMSNELKMLETRIIFDLARTGDDGISFLKSSRKQFDALDEALMNTIARQLISNNTVDHGLIVWINPAYLSAGAPPEPIHLRDTLGFFFANRDYVSDGGDVFDVCSANCALKRFEIIDQRVLIKDARDRDDAANTCKRLPILDKLEWLQQKYYPQGLTQSSMHVCNKFLENAMTEIVSVSKKVFRDIATKRIFVSKEDEFDYTSGCKLSRSDVVFYFMRSNMKGIFYDLFEEFVVELYQKQYDLLPLIRPTKDNTQKRKDLDSKEKSIVSDMVSMAETALQGFVGKGELLSRQNVNRQTLNDAGELVLENPDAIKNANNYLFGEVNDVQEQRKKARLEVLDDKIEDFEQKRLATLTVPMLKDLARKQNVNLKGVKTKKDDIIAALLRHSQSRS